MPGIKTGMFRHCSTPVHDDPKAETLQAHFTRAYYQADMRLAAATVGFALFSGHSGSIPRKIARALVIELVEIQDDFV